MTFSCVATLNGRDARSTKLGSNGLYQFPTSIRGGLQHYAECRREGARFALRLQAVRHRFSVVGEGVVR